MRQSKHNTMRQCKENYVYNDYDHMIVCIVVQKECRYG